jgi:cell division protein FtsB
MAGHIDHIRRIEEKTAILAGRMKVQSKESEKLKKELGTLKKENEALKKQNEQLNKKNLSEGPWPNQGCR